MGWSNGSNIMSDIVDAAKKFIKNDEERKDFYKEIIPSFEDGDCDTLYEVDSRDKIFKKARRELKR